MFCAVCGENMIYYRRFGNVAHICYGSLACAVGERGAILSVQVGIGAAAFVPSCVRRHVAGNRRRAFGVCGGRHDRGAKERRRKWRIENGEWRIAPAVRIGHLFNFTFFILHFTFEPVLHGNNRLVQQRGAVARVADEPPVRGRHRGPVRRHLARGHGMELGRGAWSGLQRGDELDGVRGRRLRRRYARSANDVLFGVCPRRSRRPARHGRRHDSRRLRNPQRHEPVRLRLRRRAEADGRPVGHVHGRRRRARR